LHLVGYLYYWQMGFNSVFKGLIYVVPNLITVQQDATYSVYYISVGSSTCFGC